MGLFNWLYSLVFGNPTGSTSVRRARRDRPRIRPRLYPMRRQSAQFIEKSGRIVESQPYRFAGYTQGPGHERGTFTDLTHDGNHEHLQRFGLPLFQTPEELAAWLQIRPGQLAWLAQLGSPGFRAAGTRASHYHHHWVQKRSGGWRLIEAPKETLKQVQQKILREILDLIPAHTAAHGFVKRRSTTSNARPHVGQRVVVKLDLANFYPSVSYSRVVAIFRSVGYCREAAIWLARLTTTSVPSDLSPPAESSPTEIWPYLPRHLPQGAPTSPALANLSAYGLDVRLAGLARSFQAAYTRYADDLTFSGSSRFLGSLRLFLPLAHQVVRDERFHVRHKKRKVLRNNQRQTVTGVVVNERVNISRAEFDRLKAILHNCERFGPMSQNRDSHPNFEAYVRGKIAYVSQLNVQRGEKLLAMLARIYWDR